MPRKRPSARRAPNPYRRLKMSSHDLSEGLRNYLLRAGRIKLRSHLQEEECPV